MSDFAERVARFERELVKLSSNQPYGLSQMRTYSYTSDRLYSKYLEAIRAPEIRFFFSFTPNEDVVPLVRIFYTVYDRHGVEATPDTIARNLQTGAFSMKNLHIIDGKIVFKNDSVSLQRFSYSPTLTDNMTSFSLVVTVISTAQGVMRVEQK